MTTEERNQLILEKIDEGMSLSDLQTLLNREYHIPMTYFELRMLADDLKVNWQRLDKPKKKASAELNSTAPQQETPEADSPEAEPQPEPDTETQYNENAAAAESSLPPETEENAGETEGREGNSETPHVLISFHPAPLPGTAISGEVIFPSGIRARWFMDRMGRLGLDQDEPKDGEEAKQPSEEDLVAFQTELQQAIRRRSEEMARNAFDGRTKVELSPIVKAGCQLNGSVTFASGAHGEWMITQEGLNFQMDEDSAAPTPEDKIYFQMVLQKTLQEKGM